MSSSSIPEAVGPAGLAELGAHAPDVRDRPLLPPGATLGVPGGFGDWSPDYSVRAAPGAKPDAPNKPVVQWRCVDSPGRGRSV